MEKYYEGVKLMKITFSEITNANYIQIYLTKEELEKKGTKEVIQKYKKEKYSVAIFIAGKENYHKILKRLAMKQVELSKNVC